MKISAPRRFLSVIRNWLTRQDGTATIEFVILFPTFLWLFFSSFEIGIYMTRSVLLDRSVDMSVRDLRLGVMSPMTQEELKRRICVNAMMISNCENVVTVELTPISTTTWDVPANGVSCIQRNEPIQPVVEFTPGGQNEIMSVRVCAILDPFFRTTPLVLQMPLDASGGYAIVSTSVFVNEP
ncbi:MAG TPA: pilus assembly protein [Aliiroseovarius sp.]|nr:pilus assembly protein [Aliiroseovarius sp.]